MESGVILALRRFKAALLLREDAAMREMARRWLQVERALSGEFLMLTTEAAELAHAGQTPAAEQLWRLTRYRSLLRQTTEEFERYVDYAAPQIAAEQAALGMLAIQHAERVVQLSLWEAGMVHTAFNRLPVRAIENYFGLTGAGAPVADLLRLRMLRAADGTPLPGVWDRLTDTLLQGVVTGRAPHVTAQLMADDLTGGLQKALTIARSEQMRVYRLANTEAYLASGVVKEHLRLTAHDTRVCGACLADEGTAYPLSEPIPDHPNGRCTGVPVLIDHPPPEWTHGEAWFATQTPETQAGILGPGKLAAWQAGQFDFGDLVRRGMNATWGPTLGVASLPQLLDNQTP